MDPRQLRLLQATQLSHQRLVARTRAQVGGFISGRWLGMQSWRGAEMTAFVNATIPVVLAAERRVASLTNQYLTTARNIAENTNERPEPLDLDQVTGAALRGGIEPSVVYLRPEAAVNTALSRGSSVSVAVAEGLRRALSISAMDIQLAKTHTVARQGKATWYRRTLTGSENCVKCVIASTQRYKRGNLLPIHPGCDCGIQEEFTRDPGQVINRSLLEVTHDAVQEFTGDYDRSLHYVYIDSRRWVPMRNGSTDAADYTDLILVREHGEYGPTLTWRDDKFTAATDLAA